MTQNIDMNPGHYINYYSNCEQYVICVQYVHYQNHCQSSIWLLSLIPNMA